MDNYDQNGFKFHKQAGSSFPMEGGALLGGCGRGWWGWVGVVVGFGEKGI